MLCESVKPYVKDKLLCDVIVNTFAVCRTLLSRFFLSSRFTKIRFSFCIEYSLKDLFSYFRTISGGSENNSFPFHFHFYAESLHLKLSIDLQYLFLSIYLIMSIFFSLGLYFASLLFCANILYSIYLRNM